MNQEHPIHVYADEGDVAGVIMELAKGVPVDEVDPRTNRTPLMTAIASPKANDRLVRLLIQHFANVNACACDGGLAAATRSLEKLQTRLAIPLAAIDKSDEAFRELPELQSSSRSVVVQETALSLAAKSGIPEIVELLLDAGADIRYLRPHGYDVLIDAMHGRDIAGDPRLVPLVRLLIRRGARLNTVSQYSESALSVASDHGRFDAVREILAAGADPASLGWTPLMHTIALGPLGDVQGQIEAGADLSARDFWSRTPWLLSLQTGDVPKAKLLLASGASKTDRGRCGKLPLMYPIVNGYSKMVRWLLDEGFDPNETDELKRTPLMLAAEVGATECVRLLIDAGADVHRRGKHTRAIERAGNLGIVRMLLARGADLNEISNEMRAKLTGLSINGRIRATRGDYLEARHRRFGAANPELMNVAFWTAMVKSGATAFAAREAFEERRDQTEPVWCFRRFGKSISELPDGRLIEIAGEHEDFYDPDFCIYNDVIVHHGGGSFNIFGYPREIFPPTDFHTATLVGKYIYIIGNAGYSKDRRLGETPVYRLHTDSFAIEKVATSGEKPGWISRHKASLEGNGTIRIRGGAVYAIDEDEEKYIDNVTEYLLNLHTCVWNRVAASTE